MQTPAQGVVTAPNNPPVAQQFNLRQAAELAAAQEAARRAQEKRLQPVSREQAELDARMLRAERQARERQGWRPS
jgi:DNA-binding GntR family transcriptional regulator